MKFLGVYYWYVKMQRCGCVEHGLEYIKLFVQKYIEDLAACSGTPLVRDGPLGAPEFGENRLLYWWIYISIQV